VGKGPWRPGKKKNNFYLGRKCQKKQTGGKQRKRGPRKDKTDTQKPRFGYQKRARNRKREIKTMPAPSAALCTKKMTANAEEKPANDRPINMGEASIGGGGKKADTAGAYTPGHGRSLSLKREQGGDSEIQSKSKKSK